MKPVELNHSNVNELHQFITNKFGTRIIHEKKYILEFSINKIWFDDSLKTPKTKIDIELYKHLLKFNVGSVIKIINLSPEEDKIKNEYNKNLKYYLESFFGNIIIFDFCKWPAFNNDKEWKLFNNHTHHNQISMPKFSINNIIWKLDEQPNIIKV